MLPNTKEARGKAEDAVRNINRRLIKLYGARLFAAWGLQECSADELMSRTENPEDYVNIFRNLAAKISENKLHRYSAAELRELNNSSTDKAGRECRVCGVSDQLEERPDGTICHTCAAFSDISPLLIKPDSVFIITKEEINGTSLRLFSSQGEDLYFNSLRIDKVKEILQKTPDKAVRIYSKNTYRTGLNLATKLWLGDYAVINDSGELKTFEELAGSSAGIRRIGILRADVDNMGSAFVRGFIREDASQNKYRYLTISRTATLSRSISMFFKYYINDLLENGESSVLAPPGKRNVVIVYSGGDDLFLVGAWNEVLAAALDIRKAFARYSGRSLTISAGFGMFEAGYPISRMAVETLQLENNAKNHHYQNKCKNSISLFGMETDENGICYKHTYDWDTFEEQVLGEKYSAVDSIFSSDDSYGNSFLYNITDLLRQAKSDSINLARLAYLLARREPAKNSPEDLKEKYRRFSADIYKWALREEDRKQLITAIMIYVYKNRNE